MMAEEQGADHCVVHPEKNVVDEDQEVKDKITLDGWIHVDAG